MYILDMKIAGLNKVVKLGKTLWKVVDPLQLLTKRK